MLRSCLAVFILMFAGMCAASGLDFDTPRRASNLFASTTGEGETSKTNFDGLVDRSSWRDLTLEGYNGLIGAKHTNWSAGLGLGFSIYRNIAIVIRAEYNMELGAQRDYRPQTRALMLEPTVRLHLDFSDYVALFSNHGPSITARYDFYQLDDRVSDSDLGRVTSFGVGTVNTVGLEFGDDFVRGFVETGLRTHFVIVQDADQDVEGFKDDIRDNIRFQWIVVRIGVRLHF